MWPNFQNHHGRIFPAQRTARGICPQHVDGLGVKTDEMRVVQSHSHGWAYGWMCSPPHTHTHTGKEEKGAIGGGRGQEGRGFFVFFFFRVRVA